MSWCTPSPSPFFYVEEESSGLCIADNCLSGQRAVVIRVVMGAKRYGPLCAQADRGYVESRHARDARR